MPGGDMFPIYCPACDKQGVSSKMQKVLHSSGEGMRVKCIAQGHLYAYERLMQLNPRKEHLGLEREDAAVLHHSTGVGRIPKRGPC